MLNRLRTLLLVSALATAAGCSARIDTEAVDGHIENYRHVDELQRSVRITWKCRTTSIVSSLFSASGDTGCAEERGRGVVNLPISPEGNFRIPALDVKVTKLFSSPSLYFRWEIVTVNEDGEEDTELLIGSKVYGNRFFKDVLSEHQTLRFIAIEDACVATTILARNGADRFPLKDIALVYPQSNDPSYLYDLSATLRRNGQVVRTRNLRLDYSGDQFCATGLGLHVPDSDRTSTHELSLRARIEISAGVVYSVSPPDPASGQRKRDFRLVREVVGRKATIPVANDNRLPEAFLEPIRIELDIARPALAQ
ncbi:MAG: hypothetical protein QNJ05_15475 [Woeseiaceae bacterium]|nr:hypothetical protein [Woeseiaceae bacterium]